MNTKHLIWTSPHLPVTGEQPVTKRRKRSKLMFAEMREAERASDDEAAERSYYERLGKK